MPHTVTLLSAVSPSPSWNDVIIVESAVASFARPALRAPHPSLTRPPYPLSTPHGVRPSLRTRRQHPPFYPHAFVTHAIPKFTAILPHNRRRLPLPPRCRYPCQLVEDLPFHAVRALYLRHHRHQILRSPMTCEATLFGSVPISAKRPAEAGGCPNLRRFLTI
jgi:hypothetical protein